jgi:PAS domain S-box-containing protein
MPYRFADLVNVRTLTGLLDGLHKTTGLSLAVQGLDGRMVASAGWTPGCGLAGGESRCLLPDCPARENAPAAPRLGLRPFRSMHRSGDSPPGRAARPADLPDEAPLGYSLRACPFGLCEAAASVLVEDEAAATARMGRFLPSPLAPQDLDALARRLGIGEVKLAELLADVPVLDAGKAAAAMSFLTGLSGELALQGLKRVRLAAAESALARGESRYRRLLASVTNYIYTVRLDRGGLGSVTHGPGCEAVTGYPSGAFETEPLLWIRLVHEEDRQKVVRFFETILQGGPAAPLEHRIRRKDGSERWIRNTPVATRGPEGEVEHLEGLIQDITEQKRMEAELRSARLRAEQASRAKSEFLANMSHEIRTPMNAVLGLTKLALKRVADPEVRGFLEGVTEAGASLLAVLGDILDFSKIEAGRMEIEEEEFDPAAALVAAARTLEVQARRKGLDLAVRTPGGLPPLMRGDEARFKQVLMNLLGNAVKFTAAGTICATARIVPGVEGGLEELHVSVSDTGIGIPPEKLEMIFETFTQADSTTTRRFGGAGLGLAISRKLVTMMGGRIWAESAEGRGSTFHFLLPLKAARPSPGACVPWQPPPRADRLQRPLRILLAEDEPANQIFARTFLEEEGHAVSLAEDGARVLERLSGESFDVVLMDVSMPVLDGLEATRLIREGKAPGANPEIPIVALTAHAVKGDRERFLAAGMDACVIKPVDLDELTAILARVQRGEPPGGQGRGRGRGADGVFDGEWLKKWFSGRQRVLKTLLQVFTDETPGRLARIGRAVQSGDALETQSLAHSIKGSAGVVGAAGLKAAAQRLEEAARAGDLEAMNELLAVLHDRAGNALAGIEAGEPERLAGA